MQKRARNGTSLDGIVFHPLHRASQRADDFFVSDAGEAHLTPRQFAVLLSVAESDNPSQTDVVDATGIDRSTVAEMIRRLVRNGLLQRRRSRRDARAYVVRLTDTGRQVLKSAEPRAQRAGASVHAHLSGEERRAFVEALKVVSAS